MPQPPLTLKRSIAPAKTIELKRHATSSSLLVCDFCDKTQITDGLTVAFTCCDCVARRMREPGAACSRKSMGDWRNWLPEDLLALLQKAAEYDPEAIRTIASLQNVIPAQSWPKLPKRREDSVENFESDTPRALVLAKPARANPTPPPPPPRPIFRKLFIAKPKPAPPAPLKNAVFVRTLTAKGSKPAPLILRKAPAPATPRPAPPAGKLGFRRTGEPEI